MVPVDVTDQAAVAAAVNQAQSLGTIRYAAICAGIHDAAPSETMSANQ